VDRFPLAADAVLVLVLTLGTLPDAVGQDAGTTALTLHLALWLPVVFRRRAPSAVFGVVVAVALLQWFSGIELAADLALLIALYTVAAHRRRSEAVVSAAVLEVGVVLASLSWGHEDGLVRTFFQLSGVVVAALLLGTTVQSRTIGFALLQERADRLERERDQQALIAAAAERTRIAREMHDIVAHSLSVMITLADGATLTERPDDARAAMRQVSRTGRDALADTRRVLDVLRDDRSAATLQPAPMIDTLSTLLTAVRATGLKIEMVVHGTVFDPTPTAQATLYRIVQEALTNTVKHAAATRVRIALQYREPAVDVRIEDDGTGDSRPGPHPVAGHGLVGMRERAALFGGSVDAGPGPTGGWQVVAMLPLTTGPTP
ncbi:MAG: sensor histidine kinase, partial [Nakamurella sp.]